MPPLGILYIGAVLEQAGHQVEIVPADLLQLSWKQIQSRIKEFRPDIVGVTSTTENRFQSFQLIRKAKQADPSVLTILGGPHASMAAEDCLEHIPELDLVARGEAENTMLELCQAWEAGKDLETISSIKGLSLRIRRTNSEQSSSASYPGSGYTPLPGFPSDPF